MCFAVIVVAVVVFCFFFFVTAGVGCGGVIGVLSLAIIVVILS